MTTEIKNNVVHLFAPRQPSPLEDALEMVEILGRASVAVLPHRPTVELLQAIMAAGSVNPMVAREIYLSLIAVAD